MEISLKKPEHYLRSYCSQAQTPYSGSVKTMEDVIQVIDTILSKTCLCRHDIIELNFIYEKIDQIEKEEESIASKFSSTIITEKVQQKIQSIFSELKSSSPEKSAIHSINIYHLSHFSKIVPYTTSIMKKIPQGRISPHLIGAHLPHCISKDHYAKDFKTLTDLDPNRLTSLDPNTLDTMFKQIKETVTRPNCILADHYAQDFRTLTGLDPNRLTSLDPNTLDTMFKQIKETITRLKETVTRPMDRLCLDGEIREKRRAFLASKGPDAYLPYLDNLLEDGFIYLYDYLIDIEKGDKKDIPSKIEHFSVATFSRIVLDIRHAIVNHVQRYVPKEHPNVIFLIGNTGAGKSTTLAFLNQEPLVKKEAGYECPQEKHLIGGKLRSCTFLPNIRITQENAYIDFPGFKDTRGAALQLGIELAFKALINSYNPKILIVESITKILTGANRGGGVKELAENLKEMLGKDAHHYKLALTQYLQFTPYTNKTTAREKIEKKEQQIQEWKSDIGEINDAILNTEKKIEEGLQNAKKENSEKIETLEEEIQELEEEIKRLNKKKEKGSLDRKKEETLAKLLARLQRKKKELAKLQQENTFPGQEILEKQIEDKKREARALESKIQTTSDCQAQEQRRTDEKLKDLTEERDLEGLTIEELKRYVDIKEKQIKQSEEDLLKKVEEGLDNQKALLNTEDKIIRLDDLEKLKTFTACQEHLAKIEPVRHFNRQLKTRSIELLELVKKEFGSGKLPAPSTVDIKFLHSHILEHSLIYVLNEKSIPEIGEFLHLAEMDPECTNKIDSALVKEFTEMLINLVVLGNHRAENDSQNLINNTINDLKKKIGKNKVLETLEEDWENLKNKVIHKSGTGMNSWNQLERFYKTKLKNHANKIKTTHTKTLHEWDKWAESVLMIPITLPKWTYRGRATQDAYEKSIDELTKLINELKMSFGKIKELEQTIANKTLIHGIWKNCQFSSSQPDQFFNGINQGIQEITSIYDKNVKNEWKNRIEEVKKNLPIAMKNLWNVLKSNPYLVGLMQIALCSQNESNQDFYMKVSEFLSFLLEKKELINLRTTTEEIYAQTLGEFARAVASLAKAESAESAKSARAAVRTAAAVAPVAGAVAARAARAALETVRETTAPVAVAAAGAVKVVGLGVAAAATATTAEEAVIAATAAGEVGGGLRLSKSATQLSESGLALVANSTVDSALAVRLLESIVDEIVKMIIVSNCRNS